MIKLTSLLTILFLTGCQTVIPVIPKFPDVPQELMEEPQKLELLKDDAKLSDVLTTVNNNYVLYHMQSKLLKSWQEWYKEQRHLFEEASKTIGTK